MSKLKMQFNRAAKKRSADVGRLHHVVVLVQIIGVVVFTTSKLLTGMIVQIVVSGYEWTKFDGIFPWLGSGDRVAAMVPFCAIPFLYQALNLDVL
jgi:hypothetical protein